MNRSLLKGFEPGWILDVTIKKPTTTEAWAERLTGFLREQDIPSEMVMEVSILRGTVEVDFQNLDASLADLKRVMFADTRRVSANLRLEIKGLVDHFEALVARMTECVAHYGVIRNAYQIEPNAYLVPVAATVVIYIKDASHLVACVTELGDILGTRTVGGGVRLAVSTQLHQETKPIFPE